MRLFLVETHGNRKIDLGIFKFNDVSQCMKAAFKKHVFLNKLESNDFTFCGEIEPGPLRRVLPVCRAVDQLSAF